MGRLVRFTLVLIGVAGMAAVSSAAGEPELVGTYAADGVNPDGSQYHAIVHISRRGESFLVSWLFPTDAEPIRLVPSSVGVGVASGGMLAVSYYTPQTSGVVVYRIEDEGKRLTGRWAFVGDDGTVRDETLTKLPEVSTPPPATPDPPAPPPPPARQEPVRAPGALSL